MKKITLCIITLFCCISVLAQREYEYTPLVREGVEWGYYNYITFTDGDQYVNPYRIQFKDDAIIDGKTYKKVYAYYSCTLNGADADLVGWIREENKQVFFRINPEYNLLKHTQFFNSGEIMLGVEYIIYDFSPEQVGDKITLWNDEITVESIEKIEINGKKHKQFSYKGGSWLFPIVDGFGYVNDGGGNVVLPGSDMIANGTQYSCLNYVKVIDGDYLYTRPDFNKNFINPCLGSVANVDHNYLKLLQNEEAITIMPSNKALSTIQLVDVAGAVVYNTIFEGNDSFTISTTGFAHGVYIVILSNETEKATCKIIIK